MKKNISLFLLIGHIAMIILFYVSNAFTGPSRLGFADIVFTVYIIVFAIAVMKDKEHTRYHRNWLIVMEVFALGALAADGLAGSGNDAAASLGFISLINAVLNGVFLYGIGFPGRALMGILNITVPRIFNIVIDICLNIALIAGICVLHRRMKRDTEKL